MFIAKRLRDGSVCAQSKRTRLRYSISPRNLVGVFVPSVEGQSMAFCATRLEAVRSIRHADVLIANRLHKTT